MNDYQLFGWRLRSSLPLAELLPWQGDDRTPDVMVELGSVPPLDPHSTQFSPAIHISPATHFGLGSVRVAIPAVATYWVEAGKRVIVQPVLAETAPDIRVFLLGTVLAILCFQRGLLPLHASAVEFSGRALLLSGHSGAGKSTLAAVLAGQGHRLLSDDLCALETSGPAPKILPAFPRLNLWQDTAEQLRISVEGLERSRAALQKYHVPMTTAPFRTEALVPAGIIFLRPEPVAERRQPRLLGGVEALRRYDLVHRWRLGLALGQQAAMFTAMARLLEAVPAFELGRSEDFADLPSLVDGIRALMAAAPE